MENLSPLKGQVHFCTEEISQPRSAQEEGREASEIRYWTRIEYQADGRISLFAQSTDQGTGGGIVKIVMFRAR